MKRKPLTRLQRVKLFDAHSGVCCICEQYIHRGQRFVVEHVKPLWLGGADDISNMGPAHQSCAIQKTVKEAPVKAKTDRVRANHLGIKKPRKITRWRKFNREIVIATRER